MRASLIRASMALLALFLLSAGATHAQSPPAVAPTAPYAPVFKPEELDQMVAPIALYPDALLAQVLMAATYPLEVVQAERWVRDPKHAKLKGDPLAAALQNETWDPSVKSLVPFPQILQMMSEKLDWTQRLGDAMLAQEADLMTSVQRLRKQAQIAGHLKTTEQQTVEVRDQVVVIQPANPQVVYVPAYNPTVVYGAWPYPAYPPPYYPPPPAYYPNGSALVAGMSFAAGVAIVGSIWGWGDCNWHGGSINVNYNTYNSINRSNINAGRATTLPANAGGNWQHQPTHRGGVAYRGTAAQQAYQRPNTTPAGAGKNYRGYDDSARAGQTASQSARRLGQAATQGAGRPGQGTGQLAAIPRQGLARPTTGAAPAGQAHSASGAVNRSAATLARPIQQPAAFSKTGSGRDVSAQSARGQGSRQASAARAAPARAAPSGRGGGGGRRR